MPTSTSATEEKQYGRKTIPVLKATSSTARRRRRKHAIATVTAAAFCLSLPANINAFSVDFLTSTTVRGPLHKTLNNLSGGSIPTRTSLSAVTDPEVLLKDILEASSLSSKDNNENGNGKEQIRGQTNGKHQHANNGSDDGTRTRIQMNIQDLYRLESSYDLDCNQENTDAKHHSKNKEKSLSEIKSKTSPSSSTTSTKKRNSSPSERSIHDIAKKLSFSKRKPSARTATMPGFRNKKTSQRHQSFRDGLEIAKRSNTHMAGKIHSVLHSEKEQKKRRKENSEAMYRGSASVPDSLIEFTREIHMESRITPKEEVELGTMTQEAIGIEKIHHELELKLNRKPTDNEWCAAAGKINMEALQTAVEDGMEAKDRLVTSNLRMVQGVVNLYIRNGLGSQYNAGDLMQEGITGLIRAAEKFDPERGFRFSTYAMYWIRAAVKRSQIIQSSVIKVPQRLHDTRKKIIKIESELKRELGHKPKKEQLASALGITILQLDRCNKAMAQQCFSLDSELENTLKPDKSGNRDTMYNILAAQYDNVEIQKLKSNFMKEDLVSTLNRYLNPLEVDLLLLRYGLMDERTLPYGFSGALTIAEVSRLAGLKPDKVRRIINKSLRQLRHLIAHEWDDFEKELSK